MFRPFSGKVVYSMRTYSLFSIAYVYFALLIVLFALRVALRGLVDLVRLSNAFGLRSTIARERAFTTHGYELFDPLANRLHPTAAFHTLGKVAEQYLGRAKSLLKPRTYTEVEHHLQSNWVL